MKTYKEVKATDKNGNTLTLSFRSSEYANGKPETVSLSSGGAVTPEQAVDAISKMKDAGFSISEEMRECSV